MAPPECEDVADLISQLTPPVGQTRNWPHWLILHNANEKIGCGVTHFSVRSADFGSRCFWINRPGGTTEKFSYVNCIRG